MLATPTLAHLGLPPGEGSVRVRFVRDYEEILPRPKYADAVYMWIAEGVVMDVDEEWADDLLRAGKVELVW